MLTFLNINLREGFGNPYKVLISANSNSNYLIFTTKIDKIANGYDNFKNLFFVFS